MSIATGGLSPPKILFMQLLIIVRVLVHLPYKLRLKVQTILLIHTDMSIKLNVMNKGYNKNSQTVKYLGIWCRVLPYLF